MEQLPPGRPQDAEKAEEAEQVEAAQRAETRLGLPPGRPKEAEVVNKAARVEEAQHAESRPEFSQIPRRGRVLVGGDYCPRFLALRAAAASPEPDAQSQAADARLHAPLVAQRS